MANYPAQIPSFIQLEKLPYLTAVIKEVPSYVSITSAYQIIAQNCIAV